MKRSLYFDAEAVLKSIILLGFSAFLFMLIATGNIVLYINPRFTRLTEAAAALILIMFFVQAGHSFRRRATIYSPRQAGPGKQKISLLPFLLTLLMAFLLPDSPLNANMAQNKGMNLGARAAASDRSDLADVSSGNGTEQISNNNSNDLDYSDRNKKAVPPKIDELRKSSLIKVSGDNFTLVNSEVYMYPDQYAGKEITMLGFVDRDENFRPDQFGLVRYVIACCAADAEPAGFLCEYNNASSLNKGTWLNIRGSIELGEYEGNTIPIIKVTSVNKAQQPQNPYIYPVFY